MSDLIQATSRTVKTMADGTLRLTVDISPMYAQNAFTLFGMPDAPVVLARLTQEAAMQEAQKETIEADKPKERLSGLAMLAVEWCKEPNFWEWANELNGMKFVKSESQAKDFITTVCGIESRKELNANTEAAAQFQQEIRGPYMLWLRDKGIIL